MSKKEDFEIMMEVVHPELNRPRFFSLNAIAAVTGRTDLSKLANDMKLSKKVKANFCPIVRVPVFFSANNKTYGDSNYAWDMVGTYIKKYPYPKIKGFGEAIGYDPSPVEDSFIKKDYAYYNSIYKELVKAGFEPKIKPFKI